MVSDNDLSVLRARHLDDSFALIPYLEDVQTLLDIGSGGGFPGLPLAIDLAHLNVTLIERNLKKCAFLRHVTMSLGLANIRVVEGDVREKREQLGLFESITARAVSSPRKIWSWSRRLLEENGVLLLQTSEPIDEDLLDGASLTCHESSGIGWINCIRNS